MFVTIFTGCVSTKIALEPEWDFFAKPSYEDYFDYYLFGLIGKHSISLSAVCMDQKPLGFHRITSFEDSAISAVSLGLYTPLTVQVWCGDKQ